MFDYQNLTRRSPNLDKMPPLIVSVAITGGNHGKETNPNLPETVYEQVESTFEAYQAGASLVHIHRRKASNPSEKSTSYEEYYEVNKLIRERCPDIVINNTGGGGACMTIVEKFAPVYAKPEVQSIDLASFPLRMTYKARQAPLSGRDSDITIDECFGISHAEAEMGIRLMIENEVVPEIELYDTTNYYYIQNLIDKELIKPPYWIQFVLGVSGASYSTMSHLQTMLEYVPKGSVVSVIGIGAAQIPILTIAMALGLHVRVGMEDNIYIEKGRLAESNAELVDKIVGIAKAIGRPIATPKETREMIGVSLLPREYK